MNALQDPAMIERLYEASQAGVEIDLIVRGICCLIPEQEFSRNIRVTRIVDTFLEHSRVWYFGNNGQPKLFLGSTDWMRRNLYRRIEAVTPVLDPQIRQTLIEMLTIQLNDKRKACFVVEQLVDVETERPYVQTSYLKVVLSPTDKRTLQSVAGNSLGFSASDGHLALGGTVDGAYTWMHSRKSAGGLHVSSQKLVCTNSTYESYTQADTRALAGSSYGVKGSVVLNPGTNASGGSGTGTGSSNTGGSGDSGSSDESTDPMQ